MVEKRHALGRGLDALIGDALEGTGRTPGLAFEVDIDRLAELLANHGGVIRRHVGEGRPLGSPGRRPTR